MKTHIVLAFSAWLLLVSFDDFGQSYQCTITGKVVDRGSNQLLFAKETEDLRGESVLIPIVDSKFEYQFEFDHPEAYQLVFEEEHDQGLWNTITFFPVPGEIKMILYSEEKFEKNTVEGSPFTNEYHEFIKTANSKFDTNRSQIYQQLEELEEKGKFYSDTAQVLWQALEKADASEQPALSKKLRDLQVDHSDKSAPAKVLALQLDSIAEEYYNFRYEYIESHPSPMSYFLLFQDATRIDKIPLEEFKLRKAYHELSGEMPEHPYTAMVGQMLESHQAIKVGSEFIDFEAQDLDGNLVKVSSLMDGKFVLLDLWASWCGPCIKKSRTMIPIYEKYKNKSFTVVGVAREFNDQQKLLRALEREKFPWTNLVELDDRDAVRLKYNIPFSGGGVFLIDPAGKILAVNPDAREVENIIKGKLLSSTYK
ncbi:MAG: TlpA disulfide reductase family protein [Bacteroidota bacterium]